MKISGYFFLALLRSPNVADMAQDIPNAINRIAAKIYFFIFTGFSLNDWGERSMYWHEKKSFTYLCTYHQQRLQ